MNSACGIHWGEDAFWPAMALGLIGVVATVASLTVLVGAIVLLRKTFVARHKVAEMRARGISTQYAKNENGEYIEHNASGANFFFCAMAFFFTGVLGAFAIMTWHFTSCALSVG